MNKTELIAAIAERTELSKKDAEKALKAFTDVVAEELKKGEKIQLVGFGTFEVSERAADHDDQGFQDPEVQGWQGFKGYDELSLITFAQM